MFLNLNNRLKRVEARTPPDPKTLPGAAINAFLHGTAEDLAALPPSPLRDFLLTPPSEPPPEWRRPGA